MQLTQNQVEKVIQAMDETKSMLKKELAYMPKHQDIGEITRLRAHLSMLGKMLSDNASATWLPNAQ